jgi:hypothetical protein
VPARDQPSPRPVDEVADDRVVVETQGPEELERAVRGLVPGAVAAELGHRSVGRRGQAAVRADRGPVQQQPGRLELDRAFGEPPAQSLELGQPHLELLP